MSGSRSLFSSALQAAQPVATSLIDGAFFKNRLPNAYLLVGNAVSAKDEIARYLAAALNCTRFNRQGSCLTESSSMCTNCSWIAAGNHPGALLALSGEGASGKIPVEKARNLVGELGKTSTFNRLVLIPDARETIFHRDPANSLLKAIEEPPADCVFVMFAGSADWVLPTIVSRSQVLSVSESAAARDPALRPGALLKPEEKMALERAVSEFLSCHQGTPVWKRAQHAGIIIQSVGRILEPLEKDKHTEKETIRAVTKDCIAVIYDSLVRSLRNDSAQCPNKSKFLVKASQSCEQAEQQIAQYVKNMSVVESLAYSLTQLRSQYLGETGLAKAL